MGDAMSCRRASTFEIKSFKSGSTQAGAKFEGSPRFPAQQRMLLDADVIECLASEVQPSATRQDDAIAKPTSQQLLKVHSRQDTDQCQSSRDSGPDIELHRLAVGDHPVELHEQEQHRDSVAAACSKQADSAGTGSDAEDSEAETPRQLGAAELVQRAHDRAAALHWTQKGLAVSIPCAASVAAASSAYRHSVSIATVHQCSHC